MAKMIVMDEIHVTVLVPTDLSQTNYESIRRTLNSERFLARLRKAAGSVFRYYSSFKRVKIRISR